MFGVLGFETSEVLEETKRDLVYPHRINPLTTGPGLPRFIDGSRTLKGSGAFPYVGERRETPGAKDLGDPGDEPLAVPHREGVDVRSERERVDPRAVAPDEDDIIPLLHPEDTIAADPMYKPVCPPDSDFYPLPSEAFSGRIYRKDIPNLISRKIDLKG